MKFRGLVLATALMTVGPVGAAAAASPSAAPSSLANPDFWPSAKSHAAITDPKIERQIDALLARMSLEQKVGQMIQADISAITPADLAVYPLGSILAGGDSGPYGDERSDAAKWQRMVSEFRDASLKSGAGIPILFGVDAVHGHSNLPSATIFPHNIGLGAMNDPDLIQKIGAVTATEVAASGIEWTFAPTLAVPQDLRWGRSYEGYGSDPALVARYSRAMTLGLQGRLVSGQPLAADRVAATAKHFLADGGTLDGKDQGDAKISEAELVARHAQGYPAAIDAGALTVMVSFSSWNGVKNHGNKSLLTDVLKGKMGFEGLAVGDWNGHGQVPGCTSIDCPDTFKAGLDLAMAPDSWKGLYESTVRAAKDGTLPLARIDDAVRRIVRVKAKLGLLDPVPVKRGDPAKVGAPSHLALAREAAAKSLVLLKNNGAVLPLRPGSRVLIAGPGADNMAMQVGGWTVTWQGSNTKASDFPNGQTIGKAIAEAVTQAGGQAAVSSEGNWSTRPDVAVLVYGEQPYAEFQGDVPNLAFRAHAGERELIAKMKAQKIPVVSVFLSGRPLFTGPLINGSDAFVAAWLPGSQGRGLADVLVAGRDGKSPRNFTGRLPFAWPSDAVSPVTAPLFPVGYGLDYGRQTVVGQVNEDPHVDLIASASEDIYLNRGRVPFPWRLGMDSAVQSASIDVAAQGDAIRLTWTDQGAIAIDGPAVDLSRRAQEGQALVIEWRIEAHVEGKVELSLGGGSLDLSPGMRLPSGDRLIEQQIPLRCFESAGANLKSVATPVRLKAQKGLVLTVRNVRLATTTAMNDCPATLR